MEIKIGYMCAYNIQYEKETYYGLDFFYRILLNDMQLRFTLQ